MTTTLIYRDATSADVSTILTLSHAGDARGIDTPPLDQATLDDPRHRAAFDEITADPRHRLIVAEKDGEIVGTLQISLIPGLPRFGMKRGLLENVHVRADQRGTGLGTQMVQWAIERCREAGCGMVQLTSNKVRKDAHRFYVKLGFAQSHEGFKLLL
ncbi:GNAT family N-acetyltransferase [Devosia lacusdianchii]|uniref:GNAT family N-acetyltransferase n=1 Tax=Devosia lacusdianchii TaxID=2917991 RepID=UPI001F064198|nr:GNAT family N-acetyltransferase [Devosia sp. JXJ CY 41]